MMGRRLDLICIGRLCVDLYAEQIGSRLEDAATFQRYVGGSAGNVCIGGARQGLRTAMVARVGNEQFGRFITATLKRESVDTTMVRPDSERLTGVVALAQRAKDDFPRIFFYEKSADLATSVDDLDAELLSDTGALLITGSFLVNDSVRKLTSAAVTFVSEAGGKVVLDIDYRPVLWGLTDSASDGNRMYVESSEVTQRIREVLPQCDVVVGTEDEIRVAGGSSELLEAIRGIRTTTDAVIVIKLGRLGCRIVEGDVPADVSDIPHVPAVQTEVVNSVGAGDGFLAGFLSGWLTGDTLEQSARRGNASGAIVVSRHGCSSAMPYNNEVEHVLDGERGDLVNDDALAQLHRTQSQTVAPNRLFIFAIDHRWQLEELCAEYGHPNEKIFPMKRLLFDAFVDVCHGRTDVGILMDEVYCRDIMEEATGTVPFLARAIEVPRSRPVEILKSSDISSFLRTWPSDHVAKIMVYAHPDDPSDMAAVQLERLQKLSIAASNVGRDLLVEIQAPERQTVNGEEISRLIDAMARWEIFPTWWKLPPLTAADEWTTVGDSIRRMDGSSKGVFVLGQNVSSDTLTAAFRAARGEPLMRGFAVGRAIFRDPVVEWLEGRATNADLIDRTAAAFAALIREWEMSG